MNILVVDDDRVIRKTIAGALRDGGHSVTTASDGQEAFDLIQHREYQILVTDWEMPRMSGTELCRKVRALRLRRYVYCIIITSRDRSFDTLSGFADAADDYVPKPFNANELLARVNIGCRVVGPEAASMAPADAP